MLSLGASGFVKYPEVTSTGTSSHSSQVIDLVLWDIFSFFFLVQGQVQSSLNGTSPSCAWDPWVLSFRVHDGIQLTFWGGRFSTGLFGWILNAFISVIVEKVKRDFWKKRQCGHGCRDWRDEATDFWGQKKQGKHLLHISIMCCGHIDSVLYFRVGKEQISAVYCLDLLYISYSSHKKLILMVSHKNRKWLLFSYFSLILLTFI